MTVKGKTGALITVCAGILSGAFVSGCADTSAVPPHEHSYSESEWTQDETGHWRGATCGHAERKDYGEHVYDGAADADCNICGRVRKIEENKDPADSNGEKPEENKGTSDEQTEGFIIGKNTDGLIVEGISAEYALSTTFGAVNFDALEYYVYLSENGVKCKEVPCENYQTTVYYGGNEVLTPRELTADGQYTAVVTLTGAVFAEGGKEGADGVSAQIKFTVKNGVQSFSLTEGKTEQVSSANDKMSATWMFEAVRANGDRFTFEGSDAEISPPDTETVGTRTTAVKYAGVEREIQYTVKPVPEIVNGGVNVTLKGGPEREVDGDYAVIGVDDFEVKYSVNAGYAYSVGTALFYEGEEANSVRLEAGDNTHLVTVRVTFSYAVEGEIITRKYSQEFGITVRKKQQDINRPLVYSGADIVNGSGAVRLNGQDDFTASVNGSAAEIRYSGEEFGPIYGGLVIDVKKPATVKLKIAVAGGAFCGVMQGDEQGDGQYTSGEEELIFFFAAGEYILYIMPDDPYDVITIHRVEIIYE